MWHSDSVSNDEDLSVVSVCSPSFLHRNILSCGDQACRTSKATMKASCHHHPNTHQSLPLQASLLQQSAHMMWPGTESTSHHTLPHSCLHLRDTYTSRGGNKVSRQSGTEHLGASAINDTSACRGTPNADLMALCHSCDALAHTNLKPNPLCCCDQPLSTLCLQ
jgi:hypothetical protein